MSDTWHYPEGRCPYCDYPLDRVRLDKGQVRKSAAEVGCTVCGHCAELLILTPNLTVRKPTPAELYEAEAKPLMREMQRLVRLRTGRPLK